jgi:pilus assembly protein CpaF
MAVAKTLRAIAYNATPDKPAKADGYEAILETVRKQISLENAESLSAVIADEKAAQTVRRLIENYISEQQLHLPGYDMNQLADRLYGDMAGFGFLDKYIYDTEIEEINGNSWNDIELITAEGVHKISEHFATPQRAVDMIRKMARLGGLILDNTSPAVDSYLTRGIRISAMIPPLVDMDVGAVFSLRRQRLSRVSAQQLVNWGTATHDMLDFLALCANHGISIGFAGKTGSGKTTDISYVLGSIDHNQRIFTIEETRELDLVEHDHNGKVKNRVIHTRTRNSGIEEADIDANDLLRKALRFHPDVIVPAEMRGAEAMIAQEAARTGHTVITSLHANSARMAYKRILSMCQMSDTKISTQILLSMIVEAFPIMVFKKQLPDGTRRIMEIIEATGVENGEVQATSLFRYMFSQENGGQHIRVGAISDTLANNLLENGADHQQVKRYQTLDAELASSPSCERRRDQ